MSTPARNLELEAAAFAHFDDVDSWRVFADWLLSVGDPRGELASLELQRLDGFRSQRRELGERIDALTQPLRASWDEWKRRHDIDDVEFEFKRGFIVRVSGPLAQLAGVLDELFEREPIQRLEIRDNDDEQLHELCDPVPIGFARLRGLKLGGGLGPLGAGALANLSLAALERLNLLGNEIEAETCEHLASLDTKRLAHFTLTANEIDDEGLAALLESPTRGQWRALHLSNNPIDAEGIAKLAGTRGLDHIERISLREIAAGFGAFGPLLAPAWPRLTRLELSQYGSWQHRELRDQLRERFGEALVLM